MRLSRSEALRSEYVAASAAVEDWADGGWSVDGCGVGGAAAEAFGAGSGGLLAGSGDKSCDFTAVIDLSA
jgi:hypothetical protein